MNQTLKLFSFERTQFLHHTAFLHIRFSSICNLEDPGTELGFIFVTLKKAILFVVKECLHDDEQHFKHFAVGTESLKITV